MSLSNKKLLFTFALTAALAAHSFNAQAQSITIQGRVLDGSKNAVVGDAILFRVRILSPNSARCVLYDETQTVNMSDGSGLFSINLNSGTGNINLPTTYPLDAAISNRAPFAVNSSYCASGSGTVIYTPGVSDNRKVMISFRDPATMSTWETIPEMDINPVAYAMEARTVGGFPASSLLRVTGAGLPGTAPTLTAAEVAELQALTAGTSTKYITRSASNGAQVPSYSGNPSSPDVGSVWFDTSLGTLRYYDGTTVNNLGTGNGTIDGVTAGSGLSGGGTTGTVMLSLSTSGVTPGSYGASNQVPVLTVDAFGRITTAGTTAITGTLPSGTAGQFLKSDGTSWTSQKITMGDLKSTISGDLFSSPACSAAQSLYWNSGTDQIECQNIALNASALTAGTIADARLADVATPGTYKSVTVDAKGRVTAGTNPTTLSGYGITDAILNAGAATSIQAGATGSLPAAGTAGRIYIDTTTNAIYYDNGSTWATVASATGSGGDITDVGAGTGLTGGGSSGAVTLNLANTAVSAGSYGSATQVPSFTVDAQGRLTAASNTTITGTTPGGSAGGDLSGTYPNPTVAKLQGRDVASAAPAAGQFLKYGGSSWAGAALSFSDLQNTSAASAVASAACSGAQTLYYDSTTKELKCQAIGGLAASAISSGTISNSVLPASATYWQAATGGIHYSSGNVGIGTNAPNATLQVAGSIASKHGAITSATTLGSGDSVVSADATSGPFTITLPTAVGAAGRQYTIKKKDAAANAITVAAAAGQTIDGAANVSLSAQYQYVTLVSDGASWMVTGGSTGGGASIPSGAVMSFDLASCPAGWTAHTASQNRVIVGSGGSYVLNATGGNTTASTSSDGAHSHTGGTGSTALTVAQMPSHNHGVNDPGHAHSVYDPGHAHGVSDPGHAHGVYDPGHAHQQYDHPSGAESGGLGFADGYQYPGRISVTGNWGYTTAGAGTGIGIYGAGTGIWINGAGTGIGIYGAATGISTAAAGSGAGHNHSISADGTHAHTVDVRDPFVALLMCKKN